MTQTLVTIGASDAGSGDTPDVAFTTVNSNATDAETRLVAIEGALSNNVVLVSQESDFPNQDATSIYLDPGFTYTPLTSFSHSKSIVFQGGQIKGLGKAQGVTMTYSYACVCHRDALSFA